MAPFASFIEALNVDARLRIEPAAYSLYCERGWQISSNGRAMTGAPLPAGDG